MLSDLHIERISQTVQARQADNAQSFIRRNDLAPEFIIDEIIKFCPLATL